MKRYILFVFVICFSSKLHAQIQVGVLPQVNADARISKDWKINAKLEGRQQFLLHPLPVGEKNTRFERADIELVASKTLGPFTTIGGGYLVRRSEGKFLHRLIQQFTVTQKLYGSRLSHRFRTDQTFEKDEALQLRLRYRFSWEKPLSGLRVDPKEFYLKINNEYLGLLQEGKGDLEIRALVNTGYSISDDNKLECGVDYRIERLIQNSIHRLFLQVAFYHSF